MVNLNAAVKLGTLGVDSGTNSGGYTIAAGSGGKLFANNGTLGALVSVGTGAQTITADFEIDSPMTFSTASSIGSLTVTGVVSNGASNPAINFGGTGNIILANNNSLTSNGTIAANGTLQLGNGGATGAWGAGTITDSGNLIVNRSGAFNYTDLAGLINGSGTLTNMGAGQMVWNSTLTSGGFTGTLNVAAGTVTMGTGAVLNSTLLVASAGTFDLGGNTMTFSGLTSAGLITNANATPATLDINNSAAATIGGTLTNGAGSLTLLKTGAGSLVLNGTGSYTGHTIIAAGSITVNNSLAIPVVSEIDVNVTSGLNLSNGVNLASPIVIAAVNLGDVWYTVAANSSATLSGPITAATSSQFRWGNAAGTTLTVTGVVTTSSPDTFLNGANLIFSGGTVNDIGTAPIAFGRGGSSTITLQNAIFNATSGGMALDWLTNGATSTNVFVTVNNSSLNTGTQSFDLNGGATSGTTLLLTNSIVTLGQFVRTSTGAATLLSLDGTTLVATQATDNFVPTMVGTTIGIGFGGATLNTGGFSLGIHNALTTRPGTNSADGGLTILGAGQVTFYATGSNYSGATNFSNNIVAGADNVFSGNAVANFINSGTLTAGGFSQSLGGLNDTASSPGVATGFNSLTLNVTGSNVYKFAGTVTATNMGMTGTGTQILTGATSWTGNTNIGGGKLQIGSATTAGLNISTSGTLTFTGGGEGTLAWVLGTGGFGGIHRLQHGPPSSRRHRQFPGGGRG